MKYNIKKVVLLTIVTISMFLFSQNVYASDGTISISSTASTIGNEVSVSVNVSGNVEIGTVDLWLTYDPQIIEAVSGFDGGGGGRIHILSSDNTSFTLKFKTVGVGESSINIDTGMTYVYNYNPADGDYMNYSVAAGKVSVNAPKTYSTNNDLKSLTVSPGQLTPEFQTGVLEYTMTVGEDCERLNISAQTADDKATVSVSGTQMDYGDNQTYIKVTAENGDVKTYIIYTKREGEPPTKEPDVVITVDVKGTTYNIDTDYEAHPLPEGFEEVEYIYKGQNIHIGKGISKKLYIFYLQSGEGEAKSGDYYIYNEEKDSFYKMINLSQAQGIYTIVEFANGEVDIPSGYEETDEMIDGVLRKVYIGEDKDSFLIYLMNYNGDTNWYRYDRSENTIQRYFETKNIEEETKEEQESVTQEDDASKEYEQKLNEAYLEIDSLKSENEETLKKMFIVIIILSAIIILTMFSIIAYAIKLKNKKEDATIINDLEEKEETKENKKEEQETTNNTEEDKLNENINKEDDKENLLEENKEQEFEFVDDMKVEEGIIGQDEEMLGDSISEIIETSPDEENINDIIDDDTKFINLEEIEKSTQDKLEDTKPIEKTKEIDVKKEVADDTSLEDEEDKKTIDDEIIETMKLIEEEKAKEKESWSEYDLYADEDVEEENTKLVINEDGETVKIKDGVEVIDDMFIDLDDN